jgi:ABC-2 type transport system permease protein
MLADLQAYSHSKLQFEFVDPLKRLAEDQQKQACMTNLKPRV